MLATALRIVAIDHSTMLIESTGIRLTRSTTRPNGITATAATTSVTVLSSPILVLSRCSELSSWGATAPTVEIWALERASTHPNRTITRARAGPPTKCSTRPRATPQVHLAARIAAAATVLDVRRAPMAPTLSQAARATSR